MTCVSASDCWAVGYYDAGSAYQTLIERWDGTSWAIVTSPNTSATQDNYLNGVTCASASDCWAVGYYFNGIALSDPDRALGRDLVGHRHLAQHQPHADTTSSSRDVRVGVGLLGRRLLLRQRQSDPHRAVGRDLVGHRHLAQHQRTQDNFLYGVTCVSASDCWAVGYYYNGSGLSDPDRALGRDLVGHRHLAQHQHHAAQRPLWRDVRVGVGLLGRRLQRRHAQTLAEHYTAPPPIPTSVVSRKTHGTAGDFDIDLPLSWQSRHRMPQLVGRTMTIKCW